MSSSVQKCEKAHWLTLCFVEHSRMGTDSHSVVIVGGDYCKLNCSEMWLWYNFVRWSLGPFCSTETCREWLPRCDSIRGILISLHKNRSELGHALCCIVNANFVAFIKNIFKNFVMLSWLIEIIFECYCVIECSSSLLNSIHLTLLYDFLLVGGLQVWRPSSQSSTQRWGLGWDY